MTGESVFMLYAILLGVFIVFVYDLLRILRRIIPHNILWISIEDILFWGFCATEVFLLMYHESNGTMRWFAVLGALTGMAVYYYTISRFLVKYVSLFLKKVLQTLGKLLGIVFKPVSLAAHTVSQTAQKAAGGAASQRKRIGAFLKKRLTMSKKVLKMIICKK